MFKLADGAIGPYESNDEAAGTHCTVIKMFCDLHSSDFIPADILNWG